MAFSRERLTLIPEEIDVTAGWRPTLLGDGSLALSAEFEWLGIRLKRNHLCNWMNLSLSSAEDGDVEIHSPWREEFISNPDARFTHGGILAALVDTAASFAIATRLGRPPQTIDLRIDYHSAAKPGDLVVRGKIIRLGRTIGTAEALVYSSNSLTASGRATFLVMEKVDPPRRSPTRPEAR